MGGELVVSSYQPKPGKSRELIELLRDHVPMLRRLHLLTEHPSTLMIAEDGTVLEIFEWLSNQSAREAHENPVIRDFWKRISDLADMLPLKDLAEFKKPFAAFTRPEAARRNRPVHFEIYADDPERCTRFYRSVFDWRIERWHDQEYWLVETGDDALLGINGGILRRHDPQARVCNSIQVVSIDEHCRKIEKSGGKIVTPKTAIPDVGWVAYGTDTENNLFGIFQSDDSAK